MNDGPQRAEIKYNNGNGACLCNGCSIILSYGFHHEDVERYCETCYMKMFNFVKYIATDYIELSHDKVRIQRDDYVRMARELLNQISENE